MSHKRTLIVMLASAFTLTLQMVVHWTWAPSSWAAAAVQGLQLRCIQRFRHGRVQRRNTRPGAIATAVVAAMRYLPAAAQN